eukprot:CAMPEP_0201480072 /NCGR_PEP_ID=MMETSP0151_2-20130828/4645_1 /ASSEMBLY_ACC=CAM_ASM_000257 /TAXON_ID=200890 /ORGANISM="Paramoeba atlantica, Strain 621/1 / CCAP 1560/9" /LENGTH=773 /DNA_ID=CAMNT_0047861825 /DNA_START=60 /DNA_END=2381 /DNA_ORIENTATION=+
MFQKGGKKKKEVLDTSFQKKSLEDWNVRDVGNWLKYNKLSEYQEVFFFNEIDGEMLVDLDEDDLLALPIDKIAHRKKILRKLAVLTGKPVSNSSSYASSSHKSRSEYSESEGSITSNRSDVDMSVRIKCVYHDDIRTFVLDPMETFDQFQLKLLEEFGTHKAAKYRDEEGDLITIRNTEDVRAIISESRLKQARLIIYSTRKNKKKGKSQKSQKSDDSKSQKSRKSVKKSGSVTSSSTGQEGVLENFVDAVVISNRRGVITFFNAAAENTFGWSREDVIGKNVTVLMPQSIGKVHKNFIRRYRKEGNSKIIGKGRRVQGITQDGDLIELYITLTESTNNFVATLKLLNQESAIEGVAKAAQRKNQGGEGVLSGLDKELSALDGYSDCIVVVDSKGLIQFANQMLHTELVYEPGTLVGHSVSLICDAIRSTDGSKDLLSDYRGLKRDPKRDTLLTNNRRGVICVTSKHQFRAFEAEFSHLTFLGTELYTIHLRKQQQDSISSSSSSSASAARPKSILDVQREVINSLLIPGIILDKDAIIQGTNSSCTELFGWSLSALLGRSISMLIPPGEIHDQHTSWVNHYAETGQGRGPEGSSTVVGKGREVIGLKKNGTQIRISLSVSLCKSEDDETLFIGMLQYLGDADCDDTISSPMLDSQIQVISSLAIPGCVITGDSKIRAFNKSCEELFGYSLKEVQFQKVEILMPPGELRGRHHIFIDNFVSGKKDPSESVVVGKGRKIVARHKDGHNMTTVLTVTERRDGDVVIFTGIFSPVV